MSEGFVEKDSRGGKWIEWSEAEELGMVIGGGEEYPGCLHLHLEFGSGGFDWISDDKVLADPKKFERAKLAMTQSIEAWSDEIPPSSLTMAALEGLKDALRTWKMKKLGK